MEYKKTYTPEELKDLIDWVEANRASLPKTYDLMPGVHIEDMDAFVHSLLLIARQHSNNPCYGGTIYQLFALRDKLTAGTQADA